MSSNAALAAAKRRRNVSFTETMFANNTPNTQNNTNSGQENGNSRALKGKPVLTTRLIKNIMIYRLFCLEQTVAVKRYIM